MADSERKSIFEVQPDATEEARLDAMAEVDIESGRFVAHADVVHWLKSWGTNNKLPPPHSPVVSIP